MAEHLRADSLGRADNLAFDGKAADERFVEALEQVDVLRFLAREIEERTNPPVVVAKIVPRMIHQEWKDELLHDSEDAQILVRADLVEDALFERFDSSSAAVRAKLSGMKFSEKSSCWSGRSTRRGATARGARRKASLRS